MTDAPQYDLFIIGGGINGAAIARDAAGRGLSVLLAEAQDLAGATSSASTKLIHGGLRYLEYYEFRLVRDALAEREVMLASAPHIIHPLEFVLPHEPHLRPAWMIRAGLFLYDHLAGLRKLKQSRGIALAGHPAGAALQPQYGHGFTYADCRVDDARLVALNAVDAAERGATILTRTACTHLRPINDFWQISLRNMHTNEETVITARMVVNAAGPWVRSILDTSGLSRPSTPRIRLVKGSHLIVPRLYDGDFAFILQQPDHRIVFAIPYEEKFTMIGTTDTDYSGNPSDAALDENEAAYLCAAANRSFRRPITPVDIVWSWSGVRPLLDDGHNKAASVTRDYKLVMDKSFGPTILSIFGGKITTARSLAEHAVDDICGPEKRWTAASPLPGGDIPDFEAFVKEQQNHYKTLPPALIRRWVSAYGTRMDMFAGDPGHHLGDWIFEGEIRYLMHYEWAQTVEDILWRRSKLGLHTGMETVRNLETFIHHA